MNKRQQVEARIAASNARVMRESVHGTRPSKPDAKIKPLDFDARTANDLRPSTFDGMVGQENLKPLLRRLVATARETGKLDHMLLVGSAGTGKTTTAQVVAHELGRPVFQLQAPIPQETLEELAEVAYDGDVVIVDECHLWVKPDRRGVAGVAAPEQAYAILEDKRLQTATGVVPFPDVTWIGCTTDAGLLPSPFLMRFPLQPRLDPYTPAEMVVLAQQNAKALDMTIEAGAAIIFARACRGIPRMLNRYVRNARSLAARHIDHPLSIEVVRELNSTELDGLDRDMTNMLRFLLTQRRENAQGEVRYQAGLNSIATALGKSRDSKIVALEVEPYLVAQGYVAVGHGGRVLTEKGIERAREL